MDEKNMYQLLEERYEALNENWMSLHVLAMGICTLVCAVTESAMAGWAAFHGFSQASGGGAAALMNTDVCTAVIFPLIANVLLTGCAWLVWVSGKLTATVRQDLISMLCMIMGLVVATIHSPFIAVAAAGLIPLLITVIYERYVLTSYLAVLSMALQCMSQFMRLQGQGGTIGVEFLVNLAVIAVLYILTWIVCMLMIYFIHAKKEIMLTNDLERVHLKEIVNRDALTGVGNRLALEAYLTKLRGIKGHTYHAVMMDIDSFKLLNDKNGHSFGDRVLKTLGTALLSLPEEAMAFRFGGDEFCVVFTDCEEAVVRREIRRAQELFTSAVHLTKEEVTATISAGAARADGVSTVSEMMERADKMLYEAKKQEGNSILFYP